MSFEAVTAVKPLTAQTYSAELADEWCIGSVPHGGYVATILLSAVRQHFTTTLAHLDQPDSMSMQLQYLRRTNAGPATVSIKHLKLGSSVSTVEAVLSQNGRDEVQGYITQTSFAKQKGLTLPTSFSKSFFNPPPAPIDFATVEKSGEDANWLKQPDTVLNNFRRATQHVVFYYPKSVLDPSISDQWTQFRPGGPGCDTVPWPQNSIAFIADLFRLLIGQFPEIARAGQQSFWFPTVTLNLDIKKQIPPDTRWLMVRAQTAKIHNGRMDIQVVILDEKYDLIALSSHISLILSAERNLTRAPKDKQDGNNAKI